MAQEPIERITTAGRPTEQRFRELTGAAPADDSSIGDAVLYGQHIEVKRASTDTINQVRPIRYVTLVVYSPPTDSWYVIPASDVVRFAHAKTRGQHTVNPFECCTLSLSKMGEYRVRRVRDLKRSVRQAIETADRHPELRTLMTHVADVTSAMSDVLRSLVGSSLSES